MADEVFPGLHTDVLIYPILDTHKYTIKRQKTVVYQILFETLRGHAVTEYTGPVSECKG